MPILRNARSLLRTTRPALGPWPAAVTIRFATPSDAAALRRLATLDERPPVAGDALVTEVDGELWAAVAVDDGAVIADPFRPSGELALVLAERARRLHRARRHRLRTRPVGAPARQGA